MQSVKAGMTFFAKKCIGKGRAEKGGLPEDRKRQFKEDKSAKTLHVYNWLTVGACGRS